MKNRIIKMCLLLTVMAFATAEADAQAKKPSRTTKKRTTTAKKGATTNRNATANNAAITPPVDTVKPAPVVPMADIKLPTIKRSLRNDNAIERQLVKDRFPLAYEHIREDDAAFMQRVWREIDVHEKINLPFVYKADGDQGNQRFINILLSAIKNDSITAFSADDDRFTTPMTYAQISENLVAKPKSIQVPDLAQDPDGSKGIMRDTVIIDEFNPDKVERYWIKEDWVFDKESSRMHVRILGIAPLKTITNEDGSFRDVSPVFWVYYPDLRPIFAKHEVYNGKNYGARMSWEELFESRMFASRIIKSTISNPNDEFIKSYIKDPILALLEGENVREKIFNYEQDLWSY
ncbi:gliding motility protein GldN [Paraflavitalea sp. CAU 1676]|uniref:type IX secretion system ring protein PorN/GldN n=1 Tax=Paraflavitalea sp. CAU 1676 TaxID=3032598 RepID=UPI0023DB3AC2|nr:gliding motility protein GldN [Paraflavitalea sp. CAU 1676]MDF2187210.1 gliding motility protein GldN [Paraflavitalea sp. CAU 1676]